MRASGCISQPSPFLYHTPLWSHNYGNQAPPHTWLLLTLAPPDPRAGAIVTIVTNRIQFVVMIPSNSDKTNSGEYNNQVPLSHI